MDYFTADDLANILHAQVWLLKTYASPAGMYASQIWATPYLRQGKEMDPIQIPYRNGCLQTGKKCWGSGSLLLLGVSCKNVVWSPAIPLVLSSNTGLQLLDPQRTTMKKILHADRWLSSGSADCWSSHILSAMECLAHSHSFKQNLQNCEFIDLNCFVVDLRTRHLLDWEPLSNTHPRKRNSIWLIYHQWWAPLTNGALVIPSPCPLPKCMFLDLPLDVIRSVTRFRLHVTPFAMRQLLGITCLPRHVTAVRLLIIFMMSNMLSSRAFIPRWCLRRKFAPLFT